MRRVCLDAAWTPPNSRRKPNPTAATCCGSRSCSFAIAIWPRMRTGDARSRRSPGQAGFRGGSSCQDVAHRDPQAQDRRRDSPQAARTGVGRRIFDEETDLDGIRPAVQAERRLGDPRRPVGATRKLRAKPPAVLRHQGFCLEKLPPNTARVFMMREVMELDSEEICKELTITANGLRSSCTAPGWRCANASRRNWFEGGGASPCDRRGRSLTMRYLAIRHILSCKDATRLLSQAQERPLSSFRRWRLKLHLMTCDACTRFELPARVPARGAAAVPDVNGPGADGRGASRRSARTAPSERARCIRDLHELPLGRRQRDDRRDAAGELGVEAGHECRGAVVRTPATASAASRARRPPITRTERPNRPSPATSCLAPSRRRTARRGPRRARRSRAPQR